MRPYEATETFYVEHQPNRLYTRATREARELEKRKYLAMGLVLAKRIDADEAADKHRLWARLSECVKHSSRDFYHRKIDFLERWARDVLIDEARRFFPSGNMSRLVSLIGTEEGEREFAKWEHNKDVLLDVAIERCEVKTGMLFVRAG